MVSVCDVILQNHVTKGSGNFIGRNPLRVSHHHANFGGQWHCGSGDIMILLCQVIL